MSTARLGLRARGALSVRVTGPARIVAAPFSTSQHRSGAVGARKALLRSLSPPVSATPAPKVQLAKRQKQSQEITVEAISMVLPGTFVLPPLSDLPEGLSRKLKLLYTWARAKAQEVIANTATKFMFKSFIFKRTRFKAKRSTLIPTAKALHRSLAEALSAGDKDTIRKICTMRFASPLLASIDARPRTRRYGWELVAYTNRLLYPSIKAHRLAAVTRDKGSPLVRQVVVAISSRQRRFEYDARGQVVPGSEKEVDVVENVVLGCLVDPLTWESDDWRIIGTIKPTTLESWDEDQKLIKAMALEK